MKRKDFLRSGMAVAAFPLAAVNIDSNYDLAMFKDFSDFTRILNKLIESRVPRDMEQTIWLNEPQYEIYQKMIGRVVIKSAIASCKVPNTQLEADRIIYGGYTFNIVKF